MSFMAIKGTEWASAIDPALTPALFLSAVPDGAVVLDFNPEGGDILVMSKHVEGALLPVLIVQVEMRGQNSIVAWSFTPAALAAVLSDLWDVWGSAPLAFKEMFSDEGAIVPMSLHDFSGFLQLLVMHHDKTYPAARFAERPAQIHGAAAFMMPAAPDDGEPRWEVSFPVSDMAAVRWGDPEWVVSFIGTMTLEAVHNTAVTDGLARRLNQFIKAIIAPADNGHPPIVAFKSTWVRLRKTAPGALLDAWTEAIQQDASSMAFEFLGVLVDTLKALPSDWTPSIITHNDAQTFIKSCVQSKDQPTTSNRRPPRLFHAPTIHPHRPPRETK